VLVIPPLPPAPTPNLAFQAATLISVELALANLPKSVLVAKLDLSVL